MSELSPGDQKAACNGGFGRDPAGDAYYGVTRYAGEFGGGLLAVVMKVSVRWQMHLDNDPIVHSIKKYLHKACDVTTCKTST